jgi:Winged helix DNA-binding domain
VRRIDVAERRARLARRQRIAPQHRVADVETAAADVLGLHATDPATVYLAAFARVDGLTAGDVDRALYADRTLVKHMAMRRTLWVVPRARLGAVQAAASDRVAERERRRLVKEVEAAGLHRDGAAWLADASAQVLAALADGRELTSSELRDELPVLAGSLVHGVGKSWGGNSPVGPRVLTVLSAAGEVVRGPNQGGWTGSRPRWVSTAAWLGAPIERCSEAEGAAALVRAWLRAFGPGTEGDLKWWLGSTLKVVRQALIDVGAVEVDLDGSVGHLLADDLEPEPAVEPWAALLPPLDPTTMGWFERGWYLGPYKEQLFDTTGNGGPAVWWDGRIVGGWRQDEAGRVVVQLLEDVGRDARAAIAVEAERLDDWLGGIRILPRFPSPLFKDLA